MCGGRWIFVWILWMCVCNEPRDPCIYSWKLSYMMCVRASVCESQGTPFPGYTLNSLGSLYHTTPILKWNCFGCDFRAS